jgi:serine protease Do
MPQSDQVAETEAAPSDSAQAAAAALGLNLAPVDEETKRRLNLPEDVSGVVILAVVPGSEAAAKGLQPGDVILAANNQGVASPDDVKQAVLDAKGAGRDALLLLVQNGGNTRFVALKLKAA